MASKRSSGVCEFSNSQGSTGAQSRAAERASIDSTRDFLGAAGEAAKPAGPSVVGPARASMNRTRDSLDLAEVVVGPVAEAVLVVVDARRTLE